MVMLLMSTQSDLNSLGSDNWRTREAAHRRLDNLLCASLLPRYSYDPEIQSRLSQIHRKWDNYEEKQFHKVNLWGWFDTHIVSGDSRISSRECCYYRLLKDEDFREEFAAKYDVQIYGDEGGPGFWFFHPCFATFEGFVEHINKFDKRMIAARQIGDAFLPYPTTLP